MSQNLLGIIDIYSPYFLIYVFCLCFYICSNGLELSIKPSKVAFFIWTHLKNYFENNQTKKKSTFQPLVINAKSHPRLSGKSDTKRWFFEPYFSVNLRGIIFYINIIISNRLILNAFSNDKCKSISKHFENFQHIAVDHSASIFWR